MTKSELKACMWVVLRDGRHFMVVEYDGRIDFIIHNFWVNLGNYDENLNHKSSQSLDIVQVRGTGVINSNTMRFDKQPIIWERPKIQLTDVERVILKSLSSKAKYILRDPSKILLLFDEKPKKYGECWWSTNGICGNLHMFDHLFTFITPDSEAYKISELLEM